MTIRALGRAAGGTSVGILLRTLTAQLLLPFVLAATLRALVVLAMAAVCAGARRARIELSQWVQEVFVRPRQRGGCEREGDENGNNVVRRGPGLIDEYKPLRIKTFLLIAPSETCGPDIRSFLFGGVQSFF